MDYWDPFSVVTLIRSNLYSFLDVFSAPFLSPSHLDVVVKLEGFSSSVIVVCRINKFVGLPCDVLPTPTSPVPAE